MWLQISHQMCLQLTNRLMCCFVKEGLFKLIQKAFIGLPLSSHTGYGPFRLWHMIFLKAFLKSWLKIV